MNLTAAVAAVRSVAQSSRKPHLRGAGRMLSRRAFPRPRYKLTHRHGTPVAVGGAKNRTVKKAVENI
ncbi:MAG: hypothetical protein D4R74_11945 [Betaproteobacteria bacterium]|nr:MAG: hypothetical protein D4R74_11945 [Betaproteobacteria bacterium]